MNKKNKIKYEVYYCNNLMRIFKSFGEVEEYIESCIDDYEVFYKTHFKVIERIYDKNNNLIDATIIPFYVGGKNE